MLARAFRFDGLPVHVASEDAASVRWLEEFLRPAFEVSEPRRDDDALSVRLTVDAEQYDRCERVLAEAPAGPRACFALDTQITRHPSRLVDGRPLLVDEQLACAYRVEASGVEIVAHPRSERRRIPLMRTVREIAAESCRRRAGRLQLHASALALGGRAVLFAGPKLAGKTTLMIHALGLPGAAFLSNDRVFVALDDGRADVHGMPTLVSIRPDTLQRFADLRRIIPAARHLSLRTLDELRRAREHAPPIEEGKRASLSPPQLCDALGVEARVAAPLGALVFPEVSDAVAAWEIEPLPRPAARERLAACRYGHGTDRSERTVFEDLVGGDAAGDEARGMDELLARVPAFACRLGPAAYDDPRGAADLLAALRAPAGAPPPAGSVPPPPRAASSGTAQRL